MTVQTILDKKDGEVITVQQGSSVKKVMETLIRHNIGAVVVVDKKHKPVGIVSERDIMREAHNRKDEIDSTEVDKVMSTELIIGFPTDSLEYVQCSFTNNRIRHLPIMDKDKMVGIVSIGDVVKARLKEHEIENRYLKDFILDKYPG